MISSSEFKVGDWVEVRSKAEILRTLDAHGQLDGLPFMPEMFAYCGQRFQVHKRAHKTCDTVFPIRGRRMTSTVHLETRCSGAAHDGCAAGCLLFWKDEWLARVDGEAGSRVSSAPPPRHTPGCTEASVWAGTKSAEKGERGEPTYVCQNTQIPHATHELKWWDASQYVEDYLSGNVGVRRLVDGGAYAAYYSLSQAGFGLGRIMRWFYNTFHPIWRGTYWPRATGHLSMTSPTPTGVLNLQPGELVRVKPHREILQTINVDSKNRGMYWDAEMVPYCGQTRRVLRRVDKIIDEKTGRMIDMKNPCIVLDDVVCRSRYSYCRMLCPRAFYSYWREIWLERVEPYADRRPDDQQQ